VTRAWYRIADRYTYAFCGGVLCGWGLCREVCDFGRWLVYDANTPVQGMGYHLQRCMSARARLCLPGASHANLNRLCGILCSHCSATLLSSLVDHDRAAFGSTTSSSSSSSSSSHDQADNNESLVLTDVRGLLGACCVVTLPTLRTHPCPIAHTLLYPSCVWLFVLLNASVPYAPSLLHTPTMNLVGDCCTVHVPPSLVAPYGLLSRLTPATVATVVQTRKTLFSERPELISFFRQSARGVAHMQNRAQARPNLVGAPFGPGGPQGPPGLRPMLPGPGQFFPGGGRMGPGGPLAIMGPNGPIMPMPPGAGVGPGGAPLMLPGPPGPPGDMPPTVVMGRQMPTPVSVRESPVCVSLCVWCPS
jgi:hypothetical protein